MDGEITAIPSSTVENVGGEGNNIQTPDTCRSIFDKAFPHYLAMGMTFSEFYETDHTLVIAYRKAYELKRKKDNEDMWLQGAYVYHAICRAAPLLIPFNKHPKPEEYLDKPFPMFSEDVTDESAKSKADTDKGFAYMQAVMSSVNKKFGKE